MSTASATSTAAPATPLATPTAAPTLDLAQIKIIALRALAVDGDVVYGDKHIPGSLKYDFVAYDLSTGTTRDLGTAAAAAAVSDGRLVWTTYTVENSAPQRGRIPGCPLSSVAHWRMYRLSPSDTKPSLVAKGDSVRPGLGECADSMAPLIAFDGKSVAYTDGLGSGDTITVIDVGSGRRTRTIATSGVVDELAISNGSIAYLEEVRDRTPDYAPLDDQLMLASASGAPRVVAKHANWFSMAGNRIAWMPSGTKTGVVSMEVLPRASTIDPPNPYSSTEVDPSILWQDTYPWDSLVITSPDAVAWSWPSDRSSIAYWRDGHVGTCLIPTPGASGVDLVYPIAVGTRWLVWINTPDVMPDVSEQWHEVNDPNTYAAPVSVLRCP